MARGGTKGDVRPIIIKKVKKVAGGHHGGAWKVAYADFVTAMMAFFLLLWLLTVSDKVVLQGLADFFTPSNATMSNSSGSGSILAGTALEAEGAKNQATVELQSPQESTTDSSKEESSNASTMKSGQNWQSKMPEKPEAAMLQAEREIMIAIQETPEMSKYKDHMLLEQTPDGLRIQLIDRDQRPMFRLGTAELFAFSARLIATVGRAVARMPNRVALYGHTDSAGANSVTDYGNWELSADRANSARRVLAASGVSGDRFAEVVGKASTDPLYPDDPMRPENRRLSILLMQEAPVLDPSVAP
jgi:chemotaxis protein MotB